MQKHTFIYLYIDIDIYIDLSLNTHIYHFVSHYLIKKFIIHAFSDDMCYVSNLGDSRAIMSCKKGTSVQALTKDHKPYDEYEYNRIIEAGGKIYQ